MNPTTMVAATDHPNRGRERCSVPDCDATLEPVDVLCPEHLEFLPFSDLSNPLRGMLLVAWCIATWWSFLLGAQLRTAIPIFLATAVVGGALLLLPLRHYPLAPNIAAAGWVCACVLMLAFTLRNFDPSRRATYAVIAFATTVAWLLRFGAAVFSRIRRAHADSLPGFSSLTALLLMTAVLLLAVYEGSVHLRYQAISMSEPTRAELLVLAAWSVGTALALPASLMAIGAISNHRFHARWLPAPRRPRRITPPHPKAPQAIGPSRDPFSTMGYLLIRFVDAFAHLLTVIVLAISDYALQFLYWMWVIFIGILNWCERWVSVFARFLYETMKEVAPAVLVASRVVLAPVAGLAVGAWSAMWFSEIELAYLSAGSGAELVLLVEFGAVASASLTAAWLAICDVPLKRSLLSAAQFGGAIAVMIIIIVALGGWASSLMSEMGYGNVHAGWMTIGATCVLVVAGGVAYYLRSHRALGRRRRDS